MIIKMQSEGCSNIIDEPTRITQSSATLIDHIIGGQVNAKR